MGDDGGMTERVMVAKPIHFVLVHGISGGAWCWYKIRCLMENSGYRVSCIDLKSSGIDQTDPTSLTSFDDYNKPLMDFMSNLPNNEQVLLICLSFSIVRVFLFLFLFIYIYIYSQSLANIMMDVFEYCFTASQVILVGHSAGGLSVTQATHKFANKIRLAVYVAATMLKSGYLTDEDVKDVKSH